MSHDVKYIGMDMHKEAIVIAVLNGSGKLVMETILETKASSILQFIHGLRGELHVSWEEGTWAAWLYDLLQPQVQQVLVCNPRRNALLKEGSKSDKVDARKLAELLRTGMLRPVYHGENGVRTLRELARSYQTISKDLTRVWPDAQGRTSWMGRFVDYLKAHGRLSDLAFVSFEHYPFEACTITWKSLYAEPQLMKQVLQVWRDDGVRKDVPLMVTESHLAAELTGPMTTIFAALWLADNVGSFLEGGGAAFYHFPRE